jgi:hypothetical protein
VRSVVAAFIALMFNVGSWIVPTFFGADMINPIQFLVMLLISNGGYILILISKANRDMPIPQKPSKQVANILKATIDVATSKLEKEVPAVNHFKERLKEMVMWELREAQSNDEIPSEIIEDAKEYIYNKIFENGEESEE